MALGPLDDDMLVADRFDGAFRCGLCRDDHPHEDNDWCPVARGVVCEDCCRALMLGEERRLASASHRRGRAITGKDVVAHCTACARLIRLVSEHVLVDEGESARLPMH